MASMLGIPNKWASSPDRDERRDGLGRAAARYGFRRVNHVHVELTDGRARASVVRVAHRYPRATPVPLRVAAELVAAGAPLTVDLGTQD